MFHKLKKLFLKQPIWQKIERFEPKWKERIYQMAQHIDAQDKSVLDIGCGPMWLKSYLPEGVDYKGLDYKNRGEGCIVCDLNNQEIPYVDVNTFFISGCLEYIVDSENFIKNISEYAKKVIISYCTLEDFPNLSERQARGWKNHLTLEQLIDCFAKHGMHLKSKEYSKENNVILVFIS